MTTARALSTETARRAALEDSENKIKSAYRRGLLATCDVAKELDKILREELYTVRTPLYQDYVTDHLHITRQTHDRILKVSQTVAQLQKAGLELPANETQVAELARLEPPERIKAWNQLLRKFEHEESAMTTEDVKEAVNELQVPEAEDVEVEMESDNGSQPPAARKKSKEAAPILTEKGEAALNKIRRVCGDLIADAVEDGTRELSEREIRGWAEYDDAMMRTLAYYVIDKAWPLAKAVAFNNKAIEASTDVEHLILIAQGRGGSARINYQDRAEITIQMKKT